MSQLAFEFRKPQRPVSEITPCEIPDQPDFERIALNEYCGFKAGFTNHDWCRRYYVGKSKPDGSIEHCGCVCHVREGKK